MTETAPLTARRAATRQKLLDAAFTVFADKGVLAATVEEICEKAGFTRGAFYSNFSSKDDLCIALMEHGRQADLAATGAAIAQVTACLLRDPIEDVVRQAVDLFLDAQPRTREAILVNAELRLYAARTPEVREAYGAFFDESARLFSELVLPPLQAGNLELRVPAPQALGLLQAVFQEGQVGFLLERGAETDHEMLRQNIIALFTAMLVEPREA